MTGKKEQAAAAAETEPLAAAGETGPRVFSRPFAGVRDRDIYPTEFAAGDTCPAELVDAAEVIGALEPLAEADGKKQA